MYINQYFLRVLKYIHVECRKSLSTSGFLKISLLSQMSFYSRGKYSDADDGVLEDELDMTSMIFASYFDIYPFTQS